MVIRALGGRLQTAHWTNGAFTTCRRLGFAHQDYDSAIAEVVGIVYYRTLAGGIGSAALAASLRRIADEESRHLDFQAAFFGRAVARTPPLARTMYRLSLRGLMFAILAAALLVLLLDHGRVLRPTGATPRTLVRAAWRELVTRHFLEPRLSRDTTEGTRLPRTHGA